MKRIIQGYKLFELQILVDNATYVLFVQVVLCQNHIQDQEWMDRVVTHELIHAFDHCRNKLDWSNGEHHACSEVRAASLSGDCNWKYEFMRKNFNVAKQHQVCFGLWYYMDVMF